MKFKNSFGIPENHKNTKIYILEAHSFDERNTCIPFYSFVIWKSCHEGYVDFFPMIEGDGHSIQLLNINYTSEKYNLKHNDRNGNLSQGINH